MHACMFYLYVSLGISQDLSRISRSDKRSTCTVATERYHVLLKKNSFFQSQSVPWENGKLNWIFHKIMQLSSELAKSNQKLASKIKVITNMLIWMNKHAFDQTSATEILYMMKNCA